MLVTEGVLSYPAEVVRELSAYAGSDPLSDWAKRNQSVANRHGPMFDQAKELLADAQVKRVLDVDKTGKEEADPYVLALATHLKKARIEVTVITEEKKDRPDKLSLS